MFLQRKKSEEMYLKLILLVISKDYWWISLSALHIPVLVKFFRKEKRNQGKTD